MEMGSEGEQYVEDITNLDKLTEQSILENLKMRYHRDLIYVYIECKSCI